jgi:hypothetical protein
MTNPSMARDTLKTQRNQRNEFGCAWIENQTCVLITLVDQVIPLNRGAHLIPENRLSAEVPHKLVYGRRDRSENSVLSVLIVAEHPVCKTCLFAPGFKLNMGRTRLGHPPKPGVFEILDRAPVQELGFADGLPNDSLPSDPVVKVKKGQADKVTMALKIAAVGVLLRGFGLGGCRSLHA